MLEDGDAEGVLSSIVGDSEAVGSGAKCGAQDLKRGRETQLQEEETVQVSQVKKKKKKRYKSFSK
jgi:hypothetical protein